MKSQNDRILSYLSGGRSITPLEALRLFGCFRLGARIYDIQKDGHTIKRAMVEKGGKRFAQYWLDTSRKKAGCWLVGKITKKRVA
jgi:hypothetical protein